MDDTHLTTEFRTRDFWLAAALNAAGCRMLRLDWNGTQAHFILDDESRCAALAGGYWSGSLSVSAKAMADALRTLKDRLHLQSRR